MFEYDFNFRCSGDVFGIFRAFLGSNQRLNYICHLNRSHHPIQRRLIPMFEALIISNPHMLMNRDRFEIEDDEYLSRESLFDILKLIPSDEVFK